MLSRLAGDANGRALMLLLLQAASAPYFRMLQLWLTQGTLDDPYREFMVQENKVSADTTLNSKARWAHLPTRIIDVVA